MKTPDIPPDEHARLAELRSLNVLDTNIPEERVTAEDLNHNLVARALSMGGTCTGEHGVGVHKMGFLLDEAGAGAVEMMRAIKQALDPKNILNPGKIFAL